MKQNNYFSLKRFSRLFRNDVLINHKTYLFAIIGTGIAIYVFLLFSVKPQDGINRSFNTYAPLFFMYLIAIGAIIGSSFSMLKSQIKAMNYLLVPGSTLEKFLVQFVIRIVLFIPLALLLFWVGAQLVKATLLVIYQTGFDSTRIPDFHLSDLFYGNSNNYRVEIIFFIFSIYTLLLAGSVYFNRFALIKTLIVLGIVVWSATRFYLFLDKQIGFVKFNVFENMSNIELFGTLLASLSWIFFLLLAYFKLKEKEV